MDAITTPLLSPSAAARVAAIAAKQGKPAILRLSVEGGGCSGFQYKFGLTDAPDADDIITETDAVRLVIDPVSLDLVAGCTVDFVESLGGAAFRGREPTGLLRVWVRLELRGMSGRVAEASHPLDGSR